MISLPSHLPMLSRTIHRSLANPAKTAARSAMTSSGLRLKPPNPLVIITGSTGTGKSNLAVAIAHDLVPKGEVINADAMQLYAGLPIVTNKISTEEQRGIPHHLLGTIGLEEEPWTVRRFVEECDRVIGEIRGRGRVPILVGGTGYYVHGLVLGDATLGEDTPETTTIVGEEEDGDREREGEKWAVLSASTEEIYAKLQEVDPLMARRWHPSDRRKISRSLEIWLKTGRRASEVYAEQKRNKAGVSEDENIGDESGSNDYGRLRYDSLLFWLDAEDAVLKERLDKRVDSMVQHGLIDEAKQMATLEREMKQKNSILDKSKGIWVSIGYKELEPWLEHIESREGVARPAVALQQSCIEAVKASTRRYAKRQNRYIRIRFAQALADVNASDKLFLLDCTDLDEWQRIVVEPANAIVNAFLNGEELPPPASVSSLAKKIFGEMADSNDGTSERAARKCETCNKILMTEKEWRNHIQSRTHKKILEYIRKRSLYGERRGVLSKAEDPKLLS